MCPWLALSSGQADRIVDAEDGVVECRQNVDGKWQIHGTWKRGQTARIPPFDSVELVLKRLFMPRRTPA